VGRQGDDLLWEDDDADGTSDSLDQHTDSPTSFTDPDHQSWMSTEEHQVWHPCGNVSVPAFEGRIADRIRVSIREYRARSDHTPACSSRGVTTAATARSTFSSR
jgi:hypothetical protein